MKKARLDHHSKSIMCSMHFINNHWFYNNENVISSKNMKIEDFLFHVNRLDLRLKIQIPRQTKKSPNPS